MTAALSQTGIRADDDKISGLSVLAVPSYLRSSYRKVVLISHCRHLDALDLSDTEALIVSTDWLAWRKALDRDRGAHCIHFEAMLEHWPEQRGDPRRQIERAATWMIDGGQDLSLFEGVSLGRLALLDSAMFASAYWRMWYALDRLCHRFRPKLITLIDIHSERDQLDDTVKKLLVADIADRHGIELQYRLAPPDRDGPGWPDIPFESTEPEEYGWRSTARWMYAGVVNGLFAVASVGRRRHPRVFILTNPAVVYPLLDNFDNGDVTPVLIADQWPKKASFLRACLKKGIRLTRLPSGGLNARQRSEIDAVVETVTAALGRRPGAFNKAFAHFIGRRLRSRRLFHRLARDISRYTAMLKRNRVTRVVVGDVGNTLSRVIVTAARRVGAAADELPNGMFLSDQRIDFRVGDSHPPPMIDRFLAWSRQNEDWARNTGMPVPCVRVGYPALDGLRRQATAPRPGPWHKALLLPIWIDSYDPVGLHANKVSHVVELAGALRKAGVREIRVKLHPGLPRLDYYKDALRHHGIACDVYKIGPVNTHVDWADIVVGPPNSGSIVETLATGTPYFALRSYPTLISRDYTDAIGAFDTVDALADAVRRGAAPDRDRALDYLCSFNTIPVASVKFWEAMTPSA